MSAESLLKILRMLSRYIPRMRSEARSTGGGGLDTTIQETILFKLPW